MFSKSYHSELAAIREACRVFSTINPNTASLLGEGGADPDVDRLLQGFSLLAAEIRERIEDEVPEIVHELAEGLAPAYLRPLPSCSIVEFSADEAVRERKTIGAGTELLAKPIDGTACRFRTTANLEVVPLGLDEVALDGPRTSAPVLRLRFHTGNPSAVFLPGGLRFLVHGEYGEAATLVHWLMRHCSRIEVRALDGGAQAVTLPPRSLSMAGLKPDLALLRWAKDVPQGSRLMMEYFTLPQKFLFVDLTGLDAASHLALERFEVAICFDKALVLAQPPTKETFRFRCIPVINLFPAKAEPIHCEASRREYPVVVDGLPREHVEIYNIDAVQGQEKALIPGTVFTPFVDLSNLEGSPGRRACFKVRRKASVLADSVETYLSVTVPSNGLAKVPADEQLSVDLTCTNGALPGRLGVGAISLEPVGKEIGYANIVEVTKPVLPPFGSEVYWRLVGEPGRRAFLSPEALASQVALHDFHLLQDPRRSSFGRARLDTIRRTTETPRTRMIEGMATSGVEFRVLLEEAAFASRGDVFVFGSVVNELMAAFLSVNSFVELRLSLEPSITELTWEPRQGDLPPV